jgi:NitT/TauT family transport system substrate-binding protein
MLDHGAQGARATRRPSRLAAGMVVALAALLITACSSSTPAATSSSAPSPAASASVAVASESAAPTPLTPMKIRVGYIPNANSSAMVAVATDQGLWAKYGLEPELSSFTNGPTQITALLAGDLDAGVIGPGAHWLPASGKATIIANEGIGWFEAILVQPDKGIATVEDLKGKSVGVPEGTSGDMVLQLALEKAGLTDADITKVNMDPDAIVPAFVAGQIDAAALWYPQLTEMQNRVKGSKILIGDKDFFPQMTLPGSFVASNDVIAKNPELIKRLDEVIQDFSDFAVANYDQTIAIAAKFSGEPMDLATDEAKYAQFFSSEQLTKYNNDGTIKGWLLGMENLFLKFGKLDKVVDPSTFLNTDLWNQAMAARGH